MLIPSTFKLAEVGTRDSLPTPGQPCGMVRNNAERCELRPSPRPVFLASTPHCLSHLSHLAVTSQPSIELGSGRTGGSLPLPRPESSLAR